MKLSVVMPVYNERATLRQVVERVLSVPLDIELICVDDGSSDGSREILAQLQAHHPQIRATAAAAEYGQRRGAASRHSGSYGRFRHHPGRRSRVRSGGIHGLAGAVAWKTAPMWFTARDFFPPAPHRVLYFWHSVGNWILTLLSNALTNVNLSDMETCYKAFRREVIQSIPLEEKRFGFEPEITVKIAKRKLRIYEVGISYWGRTYEEGKKIQWKDGVRALWCLVKYCITEPAVRPDQALAADQASFPASTVQNQK